MTRQVVYHTELCKVLLDLVKDGDTASALHDKHTNMAYETRGLIMQAIFIQIKKRNDCWDYWAEDQAQIRNSLHVEQCKHHVDEMIFLPSILFRESLCCSAPPFNRPFVRSLCLSYHRDVVWTNVRHEHWKSCEKST